jgi:hypothetical protein
MLSYLMETRTMPVQVHIAQHFPSQREVIWRLSLLVFFSRLDCFRYQLEKCTQWHGATSVMLGLYFNNFGGRTSSEQNCELQTLISLCSLTILVTCCKTRNAMALIELLPARAEKNPLIHRKHTSLSSMECPQTWAMSKSTPCDPSTKAIHCLSKSFFLA